MRPKVQPVLAADRVRYVGEPIAAVIAASAAEAEDLAEQVVVELEPGARLVPLVCAGFTDSHWMREAFGTVAYGFFPQKAMDGALAARLIHSADERIPVDDLELGVHALRAAATAVGA